MKNILAFLSIVLFLQINMQAQQIYTVIKDTDPDPFLHPYNFIDSLCDPEMYGTLQWAIRKANDTQGSCEIHFIILGSQPHVINLSYLLPALQSRDSVIIDGTTQPGFDGINPAIIIDGQANENITEFLFLSYSTNIHFKSLHLRNFSIFGISGMFSNDAKIMNCVINNIGNVNISQWAHAIQFAFSSNCFVQGNIIGTDRDGTILPIKEVGITFTLDSYNNLIGGENTGEGNIITNCGQRGVNLGPNCNRIKLSRNLIYNNPQAIVLGPNTNNAKQPPVIASFDGTTVTGTSVSNDIIEIFGSTGNQNANEYLTTVTADVNGDWTANVSTTYQGVVANATDGSINTSVLSPAFQKTDPCITNPLVADAGEDTTILLGQSVTLGIAPVTGNTYSWTPSIGLSDPSIANPVASPTVTTTYYLTVTDTINGCISNDSVNIIVNQNISAPEIISYDDSLGIVYGISEPENTINIYSSSGSGKSFEFLASTISDIDGNWELSVRSTNKGLIALATNQDNISSEFSNYFENSHYAIDTSLFVLEAPQEFINYDLYSNLIKLRTINDQIIPYDSLNQIYIGTSCIPDSFSSLKQIIDKYTLWGNGNPNEVVIQRYNLDYYTSSPKAKNIYYIFFPATVKVDSLTAELRRNEFVNSANSPYIIAPTTIDVFDQGTPTNLHRLWHINQIQAPDAWVFLQNTTPANNVAVIDHGFARTTHNELIGNVTTPGVLCPFNGTFSEHPTEVVSVICSHPSTSIQDGPIGIARDFLQVSSHSSLCGLHGLNEACQEIDVMPNHPRVINMSFYYPKPVSHPPEPPIQPVLLFKRYDEVDLDLVMLEVLIYSGDYTICAATCNKMSGAPAGATNPFACPGTQWCFSQRGIGYPFGLPGIIGVGATAFNYNIHPEFEFGMGSGNIDGLYYLGQSSGGNYNYNYNNPDPLPIKDETYENAGYLDIVAPGVDIDVATSINDNSIGSNEGTSLASPIVAGIAGSMLLVNNSLNPAQIENILYSTADKVGYNPNGLQLAELNDGESFYKGYQYINTGSTGNGGFTNPNLDYIMGNGRVNMLSAVMNAAACNSGGFVIDNSFANREVKINNVNDHSYLAGTTYNEHYEYDAVLNQPTANLTFREVDTKLELMSNATFRISNNAVLTFDNGADCNIQQGNNNQATKLIADNNGNLMLNDNGYFFPDASLLEINNGASVIVDNSNVTIEAGGTFHLKSGGTLELLNGSMIIFNPGAYVCIEQGAIIKNNGTIQIQNGINVGINPNVNLPNSNALCVAPCDIQIETVFSGNNISVSSCLAIISSQVINESCPTGSDGQIIISVTGGTIPYNYDWSPNGFTGDGTDTYSGLIAGVYNVTVTDDLGATLTSIYTILPPANVIVNFNTIPITCQNASYGGTSTVIPQNGNIPYSIIWNNLETTETITNLNAGIYSVTVTDALNCSVVGNTTVAIDPGNPPINVIVTQNNVSCFGGSNGNVHLTISGGTPGGSPPYSITWVNNLTGATIGNTINQNNLSAGDYTVFISDAGGCDYSEIIHIIEPQPLSATFTVINTSGCIANDGYSEIDVTGGIPTYSYDWFNGSHLNSISNVNAGSYNVTVTDFNGCTEIFLTTIGNSSTAAPVLTFTTTNTSCSGYVDGTATVNISGGIPVYNILWNNNSTSNTITNLAPGVYAVTVTDYNNECSFGSVTVNSPDLLIVTLETTGILCSGHSKTAHVTGGTQPYSYLWSNGATTQTVTNLSIGSYYITVTDVNNCVVQYIPSNAFAVQAPLPLLEIGIISSNSSGCGLSDGSANVSSVTNGTLPYTYIWSSGQNTQVINNLAPGIYNVTVTDIYGCTASDHTTISNQSELFLNITHTDVGCLSGSSGTAHVNITGGIPPYSIIWGTTQTGPDATNLSAGTYSVSVTDFQGDCVTGSVTINPAPSMVLTLHSSPPTCNLPYNDGTAEVFVFNGTPLYTYLWSNGQTTQTAFSLIAGNYTVTVTDAFGCTASQSVVVNNNGISFNMTHTNVSCNGATTGSAGVYSFINTGNPPYSYLWSGGQTTQYIFNVAAGNYSVTVTDAGGCTSISNVTISEPAPLNLAMSSTNADCIIPPNGTATVVVTGGTPNYYYWWNSVPQQYGSTANSLPAGNYTVTVNDAFNCSATGTVTVSGGVIPATPTITAGGPTTFCAGVSVTLTSSAGNTYLWSNGSTSQSIVVNTSGSYTVQVTNAAGCQSAASAATVVTVNAIPPTPTISAGGPLTFCTGSSVTLTSSAGNTYLWSNGSTSQSIVVSISGSYTVQVTNLAGCQSAASAATVVVVNPVPLITLVSITPPDLCSPNCNGAIDISVSGGGAPYTYQWSDGETNFPTTQDLNNACVKTYMVNVTNSFGCSASASFTVPLPPNYQYIGSVTGINLVGTTATVIANCTIQAGDTYEIPGQLTVNAPFTLTVNGTLKFASGKRLFVSPGASLVVNSDGLLTSNCTALWQGVWASKYTIALPHTEIVNYGTIENATIGIYASGWVRVNSFGATYNNNRQSVYLVNSHTTTSWRHGIAFNNFNTTPASMVIPYAQLTLNNAHNVKISTNNFNNSNPLTGSPVNRGIGINVIGTNDQSYDVSLCTFSGLQYGIKADYMIDISNNHFINNNRGLLIENPNSSGSKVIGNHFEGNNYFNNNDITTYPWGIGIQNCPIYIVEGNLVINGFIGIGLIYNTAFGNVIYRNDIYGNNIGLAAYLKNEAKLTCNNFGNPANLSSTSTSDYNINDVLIYKGTLFTNQDHAYYAIVPGGSINSHNRYTDSKDQDPTPNFAHKFKVKNPDGPPYQHYYYYFGEYIQNVTNDLTRIDPLPTLSLPHVTPYGGVPWLGNTYCNPVNLTLKSVHASLTQVDSLKTVAENQLNYFNAIVDNGNTDYLLSLIQNLQPNNFNFAYNKLMSASPYLTDTVLIAFMTNPINKPPQKTNLVLANSPLPYNVRSYINQMNVNNHFKLIIWAAQNGNNPRENIENEIANTNFGIDNKFGMLLTTVLNDSLYNSSVVDSVLTYVLQNGTLNERLVTNPVFIGKEKYSDALSNLSSISSLNNTTDFQIDDFIQLQQLQIQLNQAPDSASKLLLQQNESWINEIATNPSHFCQSSGLSFLEQLYDTTYGRAIDIGDDISGRYSQELQEEPAVEETDCTFYINPNPASSTVNIILNPEEINGDETITIYNSEGKKVKFINTVKDRGLYIIDVNNLIKGSYIVDIENNGMILCAQKLIIE